MSHAHFNIVALSATTWRATGLWFSIFMQLFPQIMHTCVQDYMIVCDACTGIQLWGYWLVGHNSKSFSWLLNDCSDCWWIKSCSEVFQSQRKERVTVLSCPCIDLKAAYILLWYKWSPYWCYVEWFRSYSYSQSSLKLYNHSLMYLQLK